MKPWLKLYREERGSFSQLPLMTRAIAAEILKLTDDEGVIELGRRGDDPAAAICFALGAEKNERRAVRRHIGLLIDDGYLTHDEDAAVLRVTNFERFQGEPARKPKSAKRASKESPRSLQGVSTAPHGVSTVHPLEAKSPEPLKTGPGDKEEDKDIEGDKNNTHSDGAEVGAVEPTTGEQIKELESRYPSDLCADVREGIALCRRNGKVSDSVWLKTLRQLEAHPADAVVEAMRTYAGRYADGEKGEAYLVGIARRAAKGRTSVQMPLSAAAHGLSPVSSAEEHERDAARPLPAWMMRQRETVHA